MQALKIAKADLSALDDIEKIEAEASANPWPKEITESYLNSENAAFFLAFLNNEPAGYISLSFVLDEGSVLNMAVKKRFRRLGIAKSLIRAAKDFAKTKKLSFLSLEVRESNLPAKTLYEGEGFELLGKRKGYYEKPKEDALIMQYEVNE